jgi:hypothetical protein
MPGTFTLTAHVPLGDAEHEDDARDQVAETLAWIAARLAADDPHDVPEPYLGASEVAHALLDALRAGVTHPPLRSDHLCVEVEGPRFEARVIAALAALADHQGVGCPESLARLPGRVRSARFAVTLADDGEDDPPLPVERQPPRGG